MIGSYRTSEIETLPRRGWRDRQERRGKGRKQERRHLEPLDR